MSEPTAQDGFEIEEEQELETSGDRSLLVRLITYLRPYKKRVAVAMVLIIAVSGLGIAGPLLVKMAIDRALESGGEAATRLSLLTEITLIYVGVLGATAILHYFQIMILQTTGQYVMLDLRQQLFGHLLRQDNELFDRQPVGRLMTRLTSDIEALNELFTSGLVTVAMDVFTLFAIMGVMLWLDWRLALVAFTVIPVLFGLALFFRSRVRRAFRQIRVRLARINTYLQEHIAGSAIVQAFGQTDRRMERFDRLNEAHTQAHLTTVNSFAIFFPAVELVSTGAVVLLLWQGGAWVQTGAVSLGTLVAFVQYAQRFYRPISDLSEKFNILQGAMAASERIFDLLDNQPTIEVDTPAPTTSPRDASRKGAAIRFDHVDFGYRPLMTSDTDERTPVLHGLDFEVAPGEAVAIVGSTGAGKTTIISLLCRFYDVLGGRILVDGTDIREWDPRDLRRQMALVLQDPRLFGASIRDNITLWNSEITDERVDEAVERIGLRRVVERLPKGLDEEIQEGGSRLSTGERQLVAFARALAHDPPILILDEATASVDTETETRIQRATEELLRDRTSLVIAHRLSTVRHADRILVMHHGRLVEQGSHDELMAQDKLYRRLVEIQMRQDMVGGSGR